MEVSNIEREIKWKMIWKDYKKLINDGYKIVGTHISIEPKISKNVAEVNLKKGQEEITVTSSEKNFFWHVVHLYSIPHVEDDGSDFVYIQDTNKYWKLQEEIVNLFTEKLKEFVVYEHVGKTNIKKIKQFEKNWILSEKNVSIPNTRLCQIFYDTGILFINCGKTQFKIISKEKTSLSDINALLIESQKADSAVCFSAFIIGPKIPSKKEEKSDLIIGLLVYDLKKRKTLSFNLNSLGQFQRKISNVGQNGLWECVQDLFGRTDNAEAYRSYLPVPLNLRDYTPLPWFCLAFIKGIKEEIAIANTVKLDLPLFLAFGTPLLRDGKPSYDFDAEKQRALIMLGFRENGEQFLHQVRFDMSKGERNLHIDYQIFPEKGFCYKIVGHSVINYKEIWDFSENLAIGVLLAAAYDINFEKLVVPNGLSGVEDAFKENPLTVYPLFVRSMAGRPFRLIKEDPKLLDTFLKITKKEQINDLEAIKKLEDLNLLRDNTKTILGDIVYARILQTNKKMK